MAEKKPEEQRQHALQIRDTRVFAFMDQLEKAEKFPVEIRTGIVAMLNEKIRYMMDWETAEMISSSELVPKDYVGKPNNVFLAIQTGRSLGLDPFQSVKHLYTVNGRTSIFGDMMLALAKDHKEFDDCIEEFGELVDAGEDHGILPKYARCTIKRVGKTDIVKDYTIEDAMRNPNFYQFNKDFKTGKYTAPGTWMRNGKRMMQMRARSFALRDAFPDKLSGVYDEYEIQEIAETKDITDQVQDLGQNSGSEGLKEALKENQEETVQNDAGEEPETEEQETEDEPANVNEMLENMKTWMEKKKIKKEVFDEFCNLGNLGEWTNAVILYDETEKEMGETKEEAGGHVLKLRSIIDNDKYRPAIVSLMKEKLIKKPTDKQNVLRTEDNEKAKELFNLIEERKGFIDAENKSNKKETDASTK